ncbi:hypothetical protein CR513_03483, partial [Mucuna pruriens]
MDSSLVTQIPRSCTRGPIQPFEGVPCGLLYNKTARDTRRLYKDEGVSVLSRWSSEGLVMFATGYVQHMGKYEANNADSLSAKYFYEGLLMIDWDMIDAASGGALMEHPTDMCPTLQESKMESIECVGVLEGGLQYGSQTYSNRQFDNQQFRRQPY